MSRRIDPELGARLASGATRICRCWRVRRRDGREMGFTDHDRDLTFDGTLFAASSGMNASAMQSTTGLSVDNTQAIGALSDAGISEADICSGKYDQAEVEHWYVDWERPDLRVLMFFGHFGEIRRLDGAFEVELRSLSEKLNAPVGRIIGRDCDRRLGDEKCRFDLSKPGFAVEAAILHVREANSFVSDGVTGFEARWFDAGTLTWQTGPNAGDSVAVKGDSEELQGLRRISLWQEPGIPMQAGDRFRLVAGCDKQFSTCRDKFSNRLNFRGFPHIPGDDWVAAYPRNGQVNDGSSRQRT